MSGYFYVGSRDDTLVYYAYADNADHAVRKVEQYYGFALPPQRVLKGSIRPEGIPDGDDVIDEPENLREERLDGQED